MDKHRTRGGAEPAAPTGEMGAGGREEGFGVIGTLWRASLAASPVGTAGNRRGAGGSSSAGGEGRRGPWRGR